MVPEQVVEGREKDHSLTEVEIALQGGVDEVRSHLALQSGALKRVLETLTKTAKWDLPKVSRFTEAHYSIEDAIQDRWLMIRRVANVVVQKKVKTMHPKSQLEGCLRFNLSNPSQEHDRFLRCPFLEWETTRVKWYHPKLKKAVAWVDVVTAYDRSFANCTFAYNRESLQHLPEIFKIKNLLQLEEGASRVMHAARRWVEIHEKMSSKERIGEMQEILKKNRRAFSQPFSGEDSKELTAVVKTACLGDHLEPLSIDNFEDDHFIDSVLLETDFGDYLVPEVDEKGLTTALGAAHKQLFGSSEPEPENPLGHRGWTANEWERLKQKLDNKVY